MNKDLRNSLWNILDHIWSDIKGLPEMMDSFAYFLWRDYFKTPVDEWPNRVTTFKIIRDYFFSDPWKFDEVEKPLMSR